MRINHRANRSTQIVLNDKSKTKALRQGVGRFFITTWCSTTLTFYETIRGRFVSIKVIFNIFNQISCKRLV